MAETLLHNIEQRISDIHFRLQHLLKPLETERIEVKRRSRIFWWGVLFTILVLGGLSAYVNPDIAWGFIVAFIGAIVVYVLWISSRENKLVADFNSNIVPHFISEFLTNPFFDVSSCVNSSDYYNSDLFRTGVDRYNGSNFITGNLGDTFLEFSKLHTEYKTETRSKNGGTRTTWHTIFKGVFLMADSNKHFNGMTFIFPDSAERMLGGMGRWLQEKFGTNGRGEMVYMEDPVFEKKYVVYATDPVEARYLLTPTMQHYFVELANTFGNRAVCASFINGKLNIALSGNFELFAFKKSKSLLERETIKHYVQNLLHIISVIEILDLNTRVWSK